MLALVPASAAAAPVASAYTTVELIAEVASLPAAGGETTLGLSLRPKPGWHVYWRNPGDAGKEASVRWELPPGFAVGELRFPAPHVIPFGDFVTYGFDGPVLLLAALEVPAGLRSGEPVAIRGRATWVVCDDALCVPEQADVTLTLPVGDGSDRAEHRPAFAEARQALPPAMAWPARFSVSAGEVEFAVEVPPAAEAEAPYLFVAAKGLVRYGRQESTRSAEGWRFVMDAGAAAKRVAETAAVLGYADRGGTSTSVLLDVVRTDALPPPRPAAPPARASASEVLQAVLFGLLGGLVLNLMPCVFPILSMKALGLVRLAGSERRMARTSGALYALGVVAAFLAIAALLLGLRATGQAAGWGFQLQSPWVNLGLGLTMVAIGLNLAGVYEFGARLMGLGQAATSGGDERRTAFATGLLAVVVATPCTAPFMASALGFALVQPPSVAVAVFLALGCGMALPYVALAWVPAFARALPKPGPWMATFKQALAFPMLATAVWLFWVVGQQLGPTAMAVAALAALVLAFALWAWGRAPAGGWRWRSTALVGAVACLAVATRLEAVGVAPAAAGHPDAPAPRLGKLQPQPFSPALVRRLVAAGKPVFVYFTADWCISCKVNERVALATDAVGDAFASRGVEVVRADWTSEDPTITEWLAAYDRAGVPLYLYFPPSYVASGPPGSPLRGAAVLPQVLLPASTIAAVARADAGVAEA